MSKHACKECEALREKLAKAKRDAEKYRQKAINGCRDSLTGLIRDKGIIFEELNRTSAQAQRQGKVLAIYSIDGKKIKQINDTYLHSAGDKAIKKISTSIKSCLRTADALYRPGGDEWIASAVFDSEKEAEENAPAMKKRIKETVRNNPLVLKDVSIELSVSVGYSIVDFRNTVETEIDLADLAMYKDKRKSRK